MSNLHLLVDALGWDRNFFEEPIIIVEPEFLSSSEMAKSANITMRQLDYWTKRGYVTPNKYPEGSGNAREWARYQIGEVVEQRELRKADRGHY
jgi:hypothetical protein